jgi:hypothetical protein
MKDPEANQPTGASGTGETGVGALRNEESAGISTPDDFGSQGATGEGVFGTSGGNQRSTSSGRLGSTSASASRSGSQSSRASNIERGSSGESNFYCACRTSLCTKLNQAAAPQAPGGSLDFRSTSIQGNRIGQRAAWLFLF